MTKNQEARPGIEAVKGSVAAGGIYQSIVQVINAGGGHLSQEEARE